MVPRLGRQISVISDQNRQLALHEVVFLTAGIFSVLSCIVAFWIIYHHLVNYTSPHLQKYIIRILIMIPVYTIDSYLSLVMRDYSLFFDVARDCYEAYVLFAFFKLCVEYLGGEARLREQLEGKVEIRHHPKPLCCLTYKPDSLFLHRCKQLILQFVIVKPVLAITTFVLQEMDLYGDGTFELQHGYMYIIILDNISITISMYYLILFYETLSYELKPFRPLAKFLCIKAVIFFAFWQGVAVAILAHFGLFHGRNGWTTTNAETGVQDFLICFEMFPLSLAYAYAFGQTAYLNPEAKPRALLDELEDLTDIRKHITALPRTGSRVMKNFADVANIRDVLDDTLDSFTKAPKRFVVVGDYFEIPPPEQRKRVIREGWQDKRSGDILGRWQRRYVMLINKPKGLLYYDKDPWQPGGERLIPCGFIDFANEITDVSLFDNNVFQLTGRTRKYFFRAETPLDTGLWMKAAIEVLQTVQASDLKVVAFDEDEEVLGQGDVEAPLVPTTPGGAAQQ